MSAVVQAGNVVHSFYVVEVAPGKYFAGFNPAEGKPNIVTDPTAAKFFDNKYNIKLRPNEQLREAQVAVTAENTTFSEPFRPRKRVPKEQ